MIGATTLDEGTVVAHKRYAALERRFETALVDEPDVEGHDFDPARPRERLEAFEE